MLKSKLLLTIYLICFIFNLIACKHPSPNPPIEVDKFAKILIDIHLAENYSIGKFSDSLEAKRVDRNLDSLALYYNSVLHHYGITLDEFKSAFNWYLNHPYIMDTLYQNVNRKVDSLQAELPPETKSEEEEKKNVEEVVSDHEDKLNSAAIDNIKADSINRAQRKILKTKKID